MTTDNKYNGWSNYATWRVNLEIFDNFDIDGYSNDAYELSKELQEYAEEVIFGEQDGTLIASYAFAFISDVNWYEIAEHLLESE